MITINAIQCLICNDIIFSRNRHDFHYCSCKSCFIDGGFDYLRCGGTDKIKHLQIEVDATHKELYDDWNFQNDKFGIIKSGKNNT